MSTSNSDDNGPSEGVPQAANSGEAAASTAPPPPEDRLLQLEQEKKDLQERVLRAAADFDNFRKRTRKEVEEAQTRGRESMVKELLPALDNLERALKHAAADDPLSTGVRMVEKTFL